MKYVRGAGIITEKEVLNGYVLAFDQKIRGIMPQNELSEANAEIIEADGLFIAPGLIDVHIHGSGGSDTMDGTAAALETISRAISKNGVTSFLATTMTMDRNKISDALDAVRTGMREGMPGAQLIGAHMEGPFISRQYKGAQSEEHILAPDWSLAEPYKDIIRIVTLAPELPGAEEFISRLGENLIIASMGHSAATLEEAAKGIDRGISHCTHLFNAMTGVHHRNPGVASAALSSGVFCELIADGIHVHPGVFELVLRAKGIGHVTLITDCIEAGGMGDGTYSLGGQAVFVKDGAARLRDGTLAGSVLKLNEGVRNFFENTSAKLHEAFLTASLNPARELGIDERKGSIAIGKDADFFLMDGDFRVKSTYIGGRSVFSA